MMMFKVLVLQALCSLSDDQAEFQIHDRLDSVQVAVRRPHVT